MVADGYTSGQTIDWTLLHPPGSGRRISLPTYPFERRRCWLEQPSKPSPACSHPLLSAITEEVVAVQGRCQLSPADPIVRDHRVRGQCLLPGVATLELAWAGVTAKATLPVRALRNIIWRTPFAVVEGPRELLLRAELKPDGAPFELFSRHQGTEVVHAQGEVELGNQVEPEANASVDLSGLLRVTGRRSPLRNSIIGSTRSASSTAPPIAWYSGCGPRAPGPWTAPGTGGSVCKHEPLPSVPVAARRCLADNPWHPAVAFSGRRPGLPFALERVLLYRSLEATGYAYVTPSPTIAGETLRFDVAVLNDAGELLVKLTGLTSARCRPTLALLLQATKPCSPSCGHSGSTSLCRACRRWMRAGGADRRRGDEDFGLSAELVRIHAPTQTVEVTLGSTYQQHRANHWEIDASTAGDYDLLWKLVPQCGRIYFLSGLQTHRSLQSEAVEASQQAGVWTLFRLVQSLGRRPTSAPSTRLTIVTNDAQPVFPTGDLGQIGRPDRPVR